MTVAKKTKQYVASRPAIHECLRRGIINLSALAREIEQFHRLSNRPAIVAAASRYASRLKLIGSSDKNVNLALQNAKLTFRSDMMLAVLEGAISSQTLIKCYSSFRSRGSGFNFVEGEQRAIVIFHASYAGEIRKLLKGVIVETFENVVQVTIVQSRRVMKIPGVAARLFGLLAEHGISPIESLLVGGEHLLYIHERDLLIVLELIRSGYLGNAKVV